MYYNKTVKVNVQIPCNYYFNGLGCVVIWHSKTLGTMASILLYDERFPANTTKADLVMCIRRGDNLVSRIQELSRLIQSKLISVSPGWFHELNICCNCDSNGLILGSGINHKNIAGIFAALKFKIGNVIINGCGAALIYPLGNNGILMCKRLSRAVYANVTASNVAMTYQCFQPNNSFLSDKGCIVTWNQSGSIHSMQEFDADGTITGILHHPGLHAVVGLKKSCIQKRVVSAKLLSSKHSPLLLIKKLVIHFINSFHTNHQAVSAKVIAKR